MNRNGWTHRSSKTVGGFAAVDVRTIACRWIAVFGCGFGLIAWESSGRAADVPRPAIRVRPAFQTPPRSPALVSQRVTPVSAEISSDKAASVDSSVDVAAPTSTRPVSIDEIESAVKQLDRDESLAEELRAEIAERYQKAIQELKEADTWVQRAKHYETLLDEAESRIETLREELASLPETPAVPTIEGVETEKLEALLEERRRRLAHPEDGLQQKAAKLDEELSRRTKRIEQLPDQIAELEARLTELAPPAPKPGVESLPQNDADAALQQAQRAAVQSRIAALRAELAWYESDRFVDMIREWRQLTTRETDLIEQEVAQLEDLLDSRRRAEADELIAETALEAKQAHPLLKEMATENQEFARDARRLADLIASLQDQISVDERRLDEVSSERKRCEEMVEEIGLTETIGLMLRKQRGQLLADPAARRPSQDRNAEIRDFRLKLFELEEQNESLSHREQAVDDALAELDLSGQATTLDQLKAGAAELISTRRSLIEELQTSYNEVFELEVKLHDVEKRLANEYARFRGFVDERILWIRSEGVFGPKSWSQCIARTPGLLTLSCWRKLPGLLWADLQSNPLATIGLLAALLAGLIASAYMHRAARRNGEACAGTSMIPLNSIEFGTMAVLVQAVLVPLMLGFAGWRIAAVGGNVVELRALGQGVIAAAWALAAMLVLRLATRSYSVCVAHWKWKAPSVLAVSSAAGAWIVLGTPLVAASATFANWDQEPLRESLGRVAFLSLLVVSFGTAWRMRSAVRSIDADSPVSMPGWARWMPGCAMAACIALAGLAVLGYSYTAQQLAGRMGATLACGGILLLFRNAVLSMIAAEHARRDEQRSSESSMAVDPGASLDRALLGRSGFGVPLLSRLPGLDWSQVRSQLSGLTDTALAATALLMLWGVWSDALPALGMFERLHLWETTVAAAGEEAGVTQKLVPVTAADLGTAICVLCVTIFAVRNIPGLVNVLLIERMPFDAGVHMAVASLVRYALLAVGMIAAANRIHIGWSNVQWLVAAATFGLGFGLQEIFANFVSGIIILLERPMRVGDVVTVGDTTGSVSSIRFRSTTIVDGDRKELIVPNKEFITGKLLNWTLSDRLNRIVLRVAVDGSADPDAVRKALLSIAAEHRAVLKDPAPSALLEKISNGTLEFELNVFLPSLENRVITRHELNSAIRRRFQDEGIVMAHAELALHVRSLPDSSRAEPTRHAA